MLRPVALLTLICVFACERSETNGSDGATAPGDARRAADIVEPAPADAAGRSDVFRRADARRPDDAGRPDASAAGDMRAVLDGSVPDSRVSNAEDARPDAALRTDGGATPIDAGPADSRVQDAGAADTNLPDARADATVDPELQRLAERLCDEVCRCGPEAGDGCAFEIEGCCGAGFDTSHFFCVREFIDAMELHRYWCERGNPWTCDCEWYEQCETFAATAECRGAPGPGSYIVIPPQCLGSGAPPDPGAPGLCCEEGWPDACE